MSKPSRASNIPLHAKIRKVGSEHRLRIDRIVDSFSEQLKELRKDVNAVGTKVEVLTRSLEDQNRLNRPATNGPR